MNLRKRIEIEGIVQGVGFRPFVYNTADQWEISGYVLNDSRGVVVEAEGPFERMAGFLFAIRSNIPPLASISRFEMTDLPLTGSIGFEIRQSAASSSAVAQVAPDSYVCDDCLTELFNPEDRRYRYPFINCTNCGPRYSLITAIPYDRPKTTMNDFVMCSTCQAEYDDPTSRRFHAQPNACPDCGPVLTLTDAHGEAVKGDDPVATAIELLREGKILAVKGVGGYHLAVDAENDAAVLELRSRKQRDEKSFAMMSYSPEQVVEYARVEAEELPLLTSPERPIVLLPKKENSSIAPSVAPRNRLFGVMLPSSPLHYLLLQNSFLALVMTSGNISDEPMTFEDDEAFNRLRPVADYFLFHNRRIHIRTDDSIARFMTGKSVLLRRSRGYVPRAVFLSQQMPSVLATGAELKSTICLTRGDRAFLSQHIGDLKNTEVYASYVQTISHLQEILEIKPEVVAHDLHPDFYSTRYAQQVKGVKTVAVQHHHAHLVSCLADNGYEAEAIGIIFDGLGYGSDGKIWGGEFLAGGVDGFIRHGHFSNIPMPGGDAAVKEPIRMALSYLIRTYGDVLPMLPLLEKVPADDLLLYRQMIEKGINSPLTSSCGRLFDGVAALIGLRDTVSYEGQAAMELEQIADSEEEGCYPFNLWKDEGGFVLGYPALISAIVDDIQSLEPLSIISARFHNTMAEVALSTTRLIWDATGLETVALSGGVFQNRLLVEKTKYLLECDGFVVLTHTRVPPNDGGLALGQAVIAAHQLPEQRGGEDV
jgi:hydrogenase maturation protein HypF